MKDLQPAHLVLPLGTQVVLRMEIKSMTGGFGSKGMVGVIAEAPHDATHSYTVRLPDGGLVRARRSQLSIHRSGLDQDLSQADPLGDHGLRQCVVFRCVIGSRAYGLETDDSDTDRRGMYLAPAARQWSLYGVPEQLEDEAAQECYWEMQKFLRMALKANPNILECLYSPLAEYTHPIAEPLLEMRGMFVTKKIYQTYNGYVLSQFKRLEQSHRATGAIKWKHVMHLLRLLMCGITALREGHVPVMAAARREDLLAIKRGEWTWEKANQWRLDLHREFDQAHAECSLPDHPDYSRANSYLLQARQWAAEHEQWGRENA